MNTQINTHTHTAGGIKWPPLSRLRNHSCKQYLARGLSIWNGSKSDANSVLDKHEQKMKQKQACFHLPHKVDHSPFSPNGVGFHCSTTCYFHRPGDGRACEHPVVCPLLHSLSGPSEMLQIDLFHLLFNREKLFSLGGKLSQKP